MQFKMKRLPLEDATDEQIGYWIEAQGLEYDPAANRMSLLALLSSVQDTEGTQPWVMVPDLPADINTVMQEQIDAVTLPAQQKLEGGVGDNDPKVRLKVTSTNMIGGNLPVSVGCNGRVMVLQRNLTADVPMRFYEALDKAVCAEVTQNLTTGDITESEIRNYPIQIIVWPDAEKVREWRERVDNVWMPA